MSKVRRFRWVRSTSSTVLHIKYGNTSEGPCKCGTFARKGWIITTWFPTDKVCKRCQ
jgi:hypothetical protein